MAFHGAGRQTVGDLFPGSELGHKYFCVNSSCGAPSTGLSATPCLTGPTAPAGTPRHPTALGGSAGGGAAVPQPYSNPASEVPSPAEMEPDRPIGYGAFGVVWAVTDPRDGRKVALKKMPNVFQNLVSCKRVFRELRMLCFFKHDNVMTSRQKKRRDVCSRVLHGSDFQDPRRAIPNPPRYPPILLISSATRPDPSAQDPKPDPNPHI